MKRLMILLVACMLLTACTDPTKPTTPHITNTQPSITQPDFGAANADDLKPMPGFDAQNKYLLQASVGFQEAESFFCGTDIDGHKMQYFDKLSGISGALCADPSCTHDTADCGAYIKVGASISYYDGKLYWMKQDAVDSNAFVLWQSDISGMNRKKVVRLDYSDVIMKYQPQQYAIHRGKLYMMGMANAVVGTSVGHRITLLSTPLDGSGEVTVLYDRAFANGAWPSMRFVGNYIYFAVSYREEGQIFGWTITRYNQRTGQSKVIYQESGLPQIPGDTWVTERGEVYISAADAERAYVYMVEEGQRVEVLCWEEKDYNVPDLLDGIALITGRSDGIRYLRASTYDGTVIYDDRMFPEEVPGAEGDLNMDYYYALIGGDRDKIIINIHAEKFGAYMLLLDLNNNLRPTILWSNQE